MQGGVEPPDLIDQVNLSLIDIVSVDAEEQPSHQTLERQPVWQLVRAVKGQQVREVAVLDLFPAELVNNEVNVHDLGIVPESRSEPALVQLWICYGLVVGGVSSESRLP